MNITLDIFSLVLIIGAVQGIFLALLIFNSKRKPKKINNLLGFHILLFAIGLLIPELIHLYPRELAFLININYPLMFLFGPSIYLYACFLTQIKTEYNKIDLLHLLPFLLSTVYLLPFFLKDAQEKFDIYTTIIHSGLPIHWIIGWQVECLHICIYLILTFKVVIAYHQRLKTNYSNIEKLNLNWLKYLVLGNEIIWTLYFIRFAISFFIEPFEMYGIDYYVFGISISLFVYVIGFIGLKEHVIFHGLNRASENSRKYQKSGLSDIQAQEYLSHLKNYIKNVQPYKDPGLKLGDLAQSLNILPNHLSQVINDQLNQNFFDFVNQHRVAEAKQMLKDSNQSVLQIAFEVGFNSKSTFNAAFKKHTGTTPTSFRKKQAA